MVSIDALNIVLEKKKLTCFIVISMVAAQLLCAEVAWSHSIQLYMVWMHALSMIVHKHDTVFQYRMMMR
jgi:hypothetical protein